jgi:hypothetical protein
MNLDRTQSRINELMSLFVTQVKGAAAMSRTDINRVSELVMIPLFTHICGYKNLKNLNYTENFNYPGIDLGDNKAKVAIQVTSTTDNEKIKDTLQKFVKYELYKKYDRLIIYILTEKQKTYTGSGHQEIIQDKFAFDKDKDIWDYRDLLKTVGSLQLDKARRVENFLEANFGKRVISLFQEAEAKKTETVILNLMEVTFPPTLYIADLIIDRDEVIRNSRREGKGLKWNAAPRDVAQAALKQRGLSFAVDWVCHSNQVVTFHDLRADDLALANIIDQGTAEPVKTERFYSVNGQVDEDRERVFKSLLGRCLQQTLYHQRVKWQHQDKLFIFTDEDGEAERREQWYGKKEGDRAVYIRQMKKDKPDEILRCKHLAFETRYRRIGDRWYIQIIPDWFFSYDGYKRSFFGADNIKWLKRKENNQQVLNHFRFIAHFLKHDKPSGLFGAQARSGFMSFGETVSLNSAPALDDLDWNPPKAEDGIEDDAGEDSQDSLDFEL